MSDKQRDFVTLGLNRRHLMAAGLVSAMLPAGTTQAADAAGPSLSMSDPRQKIRPVAEVTILSASPSLSSIPRTAGSPCAAGGQR